jgi:hypothetical protein
MDIKAIIELYKAGCFDEKGGLNFGLVEGAGYRDGEKIGILLCNMVPCEATSLLFIAENALKESYRLLDNEDIAFILECLFDIFDFKPWMEMKVMADCEEVMGSYLQHFLTGLSDALLERATHCRECPKE